MKWQRCKGGVWKATGKIGEFVLYKDKGGWKGHYHTPDDSYFFFLPWHRKIEPLKKVCERNTYWETEQK